MQYASEFAVLSVNQDGFASGALKNLVIDDSGMMTGIFTNGQSRLIGQLALAKFISPTGLVKLGSNLYGESYSSGQPVVSAPGTSGLGDVSSNTLELSNVDLAVEFVRMINAQRGFQANSRIITTTDELLAEVVNLKR
jgi:flagellar hook protein FlgE